MKDDPRETSWYRDLEDGTGEAIALTPALRSVLASVAVDLARDLAGAERGRRERAEAASRAAGELADKTAREQAAIRVAAERSVSAARRRSAAISTTVVFVLLAVTVIVPWLIGFLLRDSPLLPKTVEVPEARNLWIYFPAFFLTGIAVLSIVYVLVLLGRTRTGRTVGATLGLLILLIALPAVTAVLGRGLWAGAERATAEKIRTTPPGGATCDEDFACAIVADPVGKALWSAELTSFDGTLRVSRGWEVVRTATTPAVGGTLTSSQVAIFAGDAAKSSVVIATAGKDDVSYGFQLDTLAPLWTNASLNLRGVPQQVGLLMIAPTSVYQAMTFNPLTGVTLWGQTCPDTLNGHHVYEHGALIVSNPDQIVITCSYSLGNDQIGEERFGIVTATGAMTDLGAA